MLTDQERQLREAVIEFACILHGAAWRERIAETANMPKRSVLDLLKVEERLPPKIVLSVLRSIEIHLERQINETNVTLDRIRALRQETILQSARDKETPPEISIVESPMRAVVRPFPKRPGTKRLRSV